MSHPTSSEELNAVQRCHRYYQQIREQLAKVIIGQDEVIEQVLVTMFARGHALLEGVPGLAKTLLVSSLAQALDLKFKRIQFTPDLMPSDVTGTEVIQEDPHTRERGYHFLPGPIFANFVLADEINRTPPKTQAAMLEAMQERHVSIGGEMHMVPAPFIVLATQNPLEQEGTYPLPEAQLDRFLLHIRVDYPSGAEEWEIARRVSSGSVAAIEACLTGTEILDIQQLVQRVPISDQVLGYAWTLVRASRPVRRKRPTSSTNGSAGELDRADCSRWSIAPKRGRCCMAGITRRSATSRRSPVPRCAIVLPATTRRKPITSRARNWSTCCWKPSRLIALTKNRGERDECIVTVSGSRRAGPDRAAAV